MPQLEPALLGSERRVVIGVAVPNSALPHSNARRVADRGLFFVETHAKRSEEVVDFKIDMLRDLEPGETVEGARAWADPGDLFIVKVEYTQDAAIIWTANGDDRSRNTVYCRITTSSGRQRLIRFSVYTRGVPSEIVLTGDDTYVVVQEVTPPPPVDPVDPTDPDPDPPVVTPGVLTVSPSAIVFASTEVGGASAPRQVTLTNTGDTSITITGVSVIGQFIRTGSIVTIAPGATVSTYISFTPVSGGAKTGSLVVVSTGGGVSVALSGNGVATTATLSISDALIVSEVDPLGPVIELSPSTLSFASTTVGEESAASTLTIANAGDEPLTIASIAASAEFAIVGSVASIAAGASATVGVKFSPSSEGAKVGNVTIASNAPGSPSTVALSGTGVGAVVEPTGLRRLSISGAEFVDPDGAVVRLKSVNWFGAEGTNYTPHGTWARSFKSIVDQMAGFGFNCLRIPFSGDFCTPGRAIPGTAFDAALNPEFVGKTALEVLDTIIAYAKSKGLYVVLDHHRRTAGAGADGAPTDATYTQAQWIADWNVLASRYASEVAVVGADLHNEPHDLTWSAWATACEACGNAILATAPDWLIFVEGVGSNPDSTPYWWGGALKGVATRPVVLNVANKVAYSPHEYGQSVGSQSWLAYDGQTPPANWPMNLYQVWHDQWGFIYEQGIAPIWIGEFGGKYGLDGNGQTGTVPHGALEADWTEELVKYLNGDFDGDGDKDAPAASKGMSFAYWSFNPNSGDTGGLVRDDWNTPQQPKLTLIQPLLVT